MVDSNKNSEFHTLFTNKRARTHFRLFLDALDEYNEKEIHGIYNELIEAGSEDILEIRINSHGGYVKSGHTLMNIMADRFNQRCLTFIDSIAYSMAGLIFLLGNKRVIYPHSSLLLHDYSANYKGKPADIENKLEHDKRLFRTQAQQVIKPFLSKKEWGKFLDGKDLWFDAYDMCKKEMATEIVIKNVAINSKKYYKEVKRDDKN